jgi:hypothetical protein
MPGMYSAPHARIVGFLADFREGMPMTGHAIPGCGPECGDLRRFLWDFAYLCWANPNCQKRVFHKFAARISTHFFMLSIFARLLPVPLFGHLDRP